LSVKARIRVRCKSGTGGRQVLETSSPRPTVLVVDDDPAVVELIRARLAAEFDVVATTDALLAHDLVRSRRFDLHLYDLSMEPLPGLELLMLTLAASNSAAVVLMTGEPTVARAVEALRAGATDLLLKPLRFDDLAASLWRALTKARERGPQASVRVAAVHDALTRAVEAKDPTTHGHGDRVRHLCGRVGRAIGVSRRELEILDGAAALHDVGKIGVPDAVLSKPGKLTPDEFELIKRHPEVGARILEPVPGMDEIRRCVVEHHEQWSGGGYPYGRRGEEISLPGRVLILAEVFDALAHARSYKPAWPKEQIESFFRERSGSHFEPELTASFLDLVRADFESLLLRGVGPGGPGGEEKAAAATA
jgi:putative two-component system response regulator